MNLNHDVPARAVGWSVGPSVNTQVGGWKATGDRFFLVGLEIWAVLRLEIDLT